MPGRISAPGLEGRGEIQMPPVSERKETVMLIKVGDKRNAKWHCLVNSLCPLPYYTLHRLGLALPDSWGRNFAEG